MYNANTPVRYIKGLGPVKAKELNKIGVYTVLDLLEYQPLHYIYPGGVTIAEAKEGHVVIKAKIKDFKRFYTNTPMIEATLSDETGTCIARWYNQQYALQSLRSGMTMVFYGKFKGGCLIQPNWTMAESNLVNVCGGQYGVHHQTIRAALVEVLSDVELPQMRSQQGNGEEFPRKWAFDAFHFPKDKTEQKESLRDLKFDECLMLQLALAERRKDQERYTVQPMKWDNNFDNKIRQYFPYLRTFEQKRTMFTIARELQRCVPMSRLIHGEVGSGKTAVAFYAAMLAALNGKRTLILCPTTILAQQHYDTLKGMGWLGVDLCLSGKSSETANCIVIGTHALLYNESLLKSASLVIIDEFQKFGVEQRAKIQKHNPHLLLLSATPIPRTLAATVFGDLDVSTIRQLPISRGQVITRWVLPDRREAMYEIIEKELAKGRQAYIIYPRISGDEDVMSAKRGFRELMDRFGGEYTLNLLTGKRTPEDKAWVLRGFQSGKTDILVSTIIAEVGLDCPNATVMVIEGADRFGLSSLHQLRGRVCRNTDTAFCFLVSETANLTSINRLTAIEQTNDGFEIAEHDLRLRGPGEVFSTRQHGLPDLKFVSLIDDFDLMIEARDLVQSGDVGDGGVKQMMRIKYGDNLSLGDVI